MIKTDVTAIVSGGMDSVTLAYWLRETGHRPAILAFDYGQRHVRELEAAEKIAALLHAPFHRVDLRSLTPLLPGSALTDARVDVPHGHYAEESMRITVVPNRNAIMLSIAWGHAVAHRHIGVATAVHSGDHHIYPDCRPAFAEALNEALRLGTEGHRTEMLGLMTPFIDEDKTSIARIGAGLGVPFEMTWTCYEGGDLHCGRCGSCNERQEAFRDAGVPDPTAYAARAA